MDADNTVAFAADSAAAAAIDISAHSIDPQQVARRVSLKLVQPAVIFCLSCGAFFGVINLRQTLRQICLFAEFVTLVRRGGSSVPLTAVNVLPKSFNLDKSELCRASRRPAHKGLLLLYAHQAFSFSFRF